MVPEIQPQPRGDDGLAVPKGVREGVRKKVFVVKVLFATVFAEVFERPAAPRAALRTRAVYIYE